ncbi:LysM peptidoglycan-binding domain-containing protein [Streptomyces hoynatensis]|uniref:LysM peptidoglycan-binding domain-containing protein n=1 Tax=Streptomyces hoynatensis TaxID=1141874 RepID=A0A3A9YLS2_9ACTN|nr:transglycosylase family protein [Streptomyces hoynatensis]RKN37355.1 LysM peptidoglycan-binding domain-containing protein [Streptomyces hoynatensis]
MRSGTGRHRRPRQAPAFIVAAGVTGAGMALPLLTAGGAGAVGDDAWDRAAECESGGVWSANTGNGLYGGFQLTLDTWEEYGGLEFAMRPDLASRAQQIQVMERILAQLGAQALPGCGVSSGLWPEFREDRGDEIDRAEEAEEAQAEEEIGGPEESASPSPSGDGGAESAEGDAGAAEGSGDAAAEGDSGAGSSGQGGDEESAAGGGAESAGGGGERGSSGEPDAGAEEGASGSGRHRGLPDPAEDAGGSGGSGEAGGAERADRSGRSGQARAGDTYEVRRGDTLWAIAGEYGVPGGWPALYAANKTVIGGNPDYILPGQELDLTASGR